MNVYVTGQDGTPLARWLGWSAPAVPGSGDHLLLPDGTDRTVTRVTWQIYTDSTQAVTLHVL